MEERLAALTRTMDAEAIMVGWYGRVIVVCSWMLLDVLDLDLDVGLDVWMLVLDLGCSTSLDDRNSQIITI